MKYSVACCFLTHNHPDIVEEILTRCLKVYAEHGIDICVYDDSDDYKTGQVVEKFIFEGAANLFYVDIHTAVNGDHKYCLILQGYGLPRDYDYIWPCKDRVCFDASYINRICTAIDEGHDVVMGYNEKTRWDVGIKVMQDVYSDPVELYRRYASSSTDWEALIRRRDTMLIPIDWETYERLYGVGSDCNFNQTLTLYARLSEMDACSVKICRYSYEERFISKKGGSSWRDRMFQLWIDRWCHSNYLLPSIYDRYKAEAIKSETNLVALFGSVDNFIKYREAGLFDINVFTKYKDIWEYVTEIPPEYLRMIASNDYVGAIRATIYDFENCFLTRDFSKAWWIITSNVFFKSFYDEEKHKALMVYFEKYRSDMIKYGVSSAFDGINSIQDVR